MSDSKLFTKSIDEKLFQQYHKGNDLANQVVVAKIFNPYGAGTWYLINSDPNDPDYIWAIVSLFENEVGSVSRSELETMRVPPFGLGLERDTNFAQVNAKELYKRLMSDASYDKGGVVDGANVVLKEDGTWFEITEEEEQAVERAARSHTHEEMQEMFPQYAKGGISEKQMPKTEKLIGEIKSKGKCTHGSVSTSKDGMQYRYDKYKVDAPAPNSLVALFNEAAAENGKKFETNFSFGSYSFSYNRPNFKGQSNGDIIMSELVVIGDGTYEHGGEAEGMLEGFLIEDGNWVYLQNGRGVSGHATIKDNGTVKITLFDPTEENVAFYKANREKIVQGIYDDEADD